MLALYSRDFQTCVSCDSTAPSCPVCDEGYTCTMISQSCSQCATTKCVQMSTSASSSSHSSDGGGSNVGAIAGGVIGGVAFVAIVTFLIWWFFVRKKRSEFNHQNSDAAEKRSAFGDTRQSRKSTNSIASSLDSRIKRHSDSLYPWCHQPITARDPGITGAAGTASSWRLTGSALFHAR